MITGNTKREEKRIFDLARDYKIKGFRVSVMPRGHDVPEFLRKLNYQPDLIARSEDESLVIEVSSRSTAEQLGLLTEVVNAIEAKKGWKFVLVMTNPKSIRGAIPIPTGLSLHFLSYSLDNAKALKNHSDASGGRYSSAVLLQTWAVVEGSLRTLLASKVPEYDTRSPKSVARDGVIFGFVTPEDGEFLDSLSSKRSAVAHGLSEADVSSHDLTRLVEIGESLVRLKSQE